jgi:protein-S-isoprenylcysteine O-methyltransferase Ste14
MTEAPFRIALVLIFALTSGVTVYYRRRAAASGERISRRAEGWLLATVLRLSGAMLWGSTLAWLAAPDLVRWATVPVPTPLRWVAVTAGLACCPLMYWTLSSLDTNLTDTVVTRATATLITAGPYRWVRHPFYVTAALLMACSTVIAANALMGGLSVLVLALLATRTPLEERMLLERFGQRYAEYMQSTGRFLPRWTVKPPADLSGG